MKRIAAGHYTINGYRITRIGHYYWLAINQATGHRVTAGTLTDLRARLGF